MAHTRQQIRNFVHATLAPLASSTGAKQIYKSRAFIKSAFPWISVYTTDERIEVENPGVINVDKRYRRFQTVAVEIGVLTNNAPDDALDSLATQVEILLGTDETMGGGVLATDLLATAFNMNGDGDEQFMTCQLLYTVEHRTQDNDPETFLN